VSPAFHPVPKNGVEQGYTSKKGGNPPMSLRLKMYEKLLTEFKEEVRCNPDADFTQEIQGLAAEFIKMEQERKQRIANSLLLGLYEGDTQSLKRDITKLIMLGPAKAVPSQRVELLRCICGILSLHTKEDFSHILAECDRLEGADEEE